MDTVRDQKQYFSKIIVISEKASTWRSVKALVSFYMDLVTYLSETRQDGSDMSCVHPTLRLESISTMFTLVVYTTLKLEPRENNAELSVTCSFVKYCFNRSI